MEHLPEDNIALNVGGSFFNVGRGLLCTFPGSKLEVIFNGKEQPTMLDGCVFLDRNPEVWPYVIKCLEGNLSL